MDANALKSARKRELAAENALKEAKRASLTGRVQFKVPQAAPSRSSLQNANANDDPINQDAYDACFGDGGDFFQDTMDVVSEANSKGSSV